MWKKAKRNHNNSPNHHIGWMRMTEKSSTLTAFKHSWLESWLCGNITACIKCIIILALHLLLYYYCGTDIKCLFVFPRLQRVTASVMNKTYFIHHNTNDINTTNDDQWWCHQGNMLLVNFHYAVSRADCVGSSEVLNLCFVLVVAWLKRDTVYFHWSSNIRFEISLSHDDCFCISITKVTLTKHGLMNYRTVKNVQFVYAVSNYTGL